MILLRVILITFLVVLSGCWCATLSESVKKAEGHKKMAINPLDFRNKTIEYKKALDEFTQAQNDPNTTEEELEELREKVKNTRDELYEMYTETKNNKSTENFEDPALKKMIERANEAREKAEEAREDRSDQESEDRFIPKNINEEERERFIEMTNSIMENASISGDIEEAEGYVQDSDSDPDFSVND